MRLLITGGLGFIGSNFINYWVKNHPKDSIVNLDSETYAAKKNNIAFNIVKGNYEFVSGDICNRNLVHKLISNVDTVINFAAESHVDNSIEKPEQFLQSNYFGVYSLLESVREYDVRFHQVSTDEVYGSLPPDSKKKFDEYSCYNPKNPYAATKAAADHLVRSYVNTYGIRATISNCSNNFGPNQHTEKFIPKIITNARSNKKIPIYGNGHNSRDWIYVDDHCKGIDMILSKGVIGETYLFGGGNEITNLDLASKILYMMGKDEKLIEFVQDRKGHDTRYAIDSSKAERELGWRVCHPFETSLSLTIEFYSQDISGPQ